MKYTKNNSGVRQVIGSVLTNDNLFYHFESKRIPKDFPVLTEEQCVKLLMLDVPGLEEFLIKGKWETKPYETSDILLGLDDNTFEVLEPKLSENLGKI